MRPTFSCTSTRRNLGENKQLARFEIGKGLTETPRLITGTPPSLPAHVALWTVLVGVVLVSNLVKKV